MSRREPLAEIVIPGRVVGKKTSPRLTYPGIASLRLRKTKAQLQEDRAAARRAGKNAVRVPALVMGPNALLRHLRELVETSPAKAAEVLRRAEGRLAPRVQPPTEFTRWQRDAERIARQAPGPRPLLPEGHMAEVETVIFMAAGQRGDLVNFEQGVWDLLQEAGLVSNDHWINAHGESRRRWDEPWAPRVEIRIFDIGPRVEYAAPKVTIRGLGQQPDFEPVRYVVASGGLEVEGVAPKGSSRDQLIREAERLWRVRFEVPLPDGAVIDTRPERERERKLFDG